jgi:hypothetical protein
MYRSRKQIAGTRNLMLRVPARCSCACYACLLLLRLLRGSLPRISAFCKLLDHLLIERGYIARLPTGY